MAGFAHDVVGELEQKLQNTITQRFHELTFVNGLDVPTTFDLEPGVDAVSVDIITGYGQGKLLAPEAADIPLVQVNVTKDKAPVVMAVAGYAMGFQAERSYSYSGKSSLISDRSVLTVRRAIDERLHYFAAYGETSVGSAGLYNNPNITPVTSSFNPNTATFADWISFILDSVLGIGLSTYNTIIPDEVFLSRNMIKRMMSVTDTYNSNVSALMAVRQRLDVLDGYQNVQIRSRPESDSAMLEAKGVMASGTNRDRVVVYKKDPMTLARQMESSIAQMMPSKYSFSAGDGRIVYPMFSCASATQVYETNGISYIDVARAT